MTGLRPLTTGVLVNNRPVRHRLPDVVTLPQLFRNHGYFAARAGKVYHLGIPGGVGTPGNDDPASWDHTFDPKGNEYPKEDEGETHDPDPKNHQSFRRHALNDDGATQADHQIATETIRLLNENKDKPFFITCGFIRPHVPLIAPKKFFDLYDLSKITLPDNPTNDRDDIPAPAFMYPPNMNMSHEECVESKRAYYAATSFMDHQAGRVLAELDRLGLRDNTIVVFLSDHGYSLGQHFSWQKMTLFEEVCRVPMIVSYPGMKHRNAAARGLAESIDMYPTVADLADLPLPKELEGKSLRPILENPDRPFKKAAFTMLDRRGTNVPGRTVRTDRFRYTEWDYGRAGAELYDYAADPREFTNLANDPKHAATVRELRSLLHAEYPKPDRLPNPTPATVK
jgi:uncharacterized sulfatase